jgi:hypothetical protein
LNSFFAARLFEGNLVTSADVGWLNFKNDLLGGVFLVKSETKKVEGGHDGYVGNVGVPLNQK